MIVGAHSIVFSRDANADRVFLADVLGFDGVDAGGGWLVFALPPGELAVHPTEGTPRFDLYLMCDDVEATVAELEGRGASFRAGVSEERWGLVTSFELPGGATVGLYEPRHPSPLRPGRN